MTSVRSYPFRRAPARAVRCTEWQIHREGAATAVPRALDHWDPATPIVLSRTVTIDERAVRAECRLRDDDEIGIAVTWHSSGTSLRGRGSASTLAPSTTAVPNAIGVSIDGAKLAVELTVTTQLHLARLSLHPRPRIAASRVGSVLWSDEITIALEGGAPRFPMELVRFRDHAWLPEDALYFLDWDADDLQVPVLGGPRLLLNADHPAARHLIGSPSDEVSTAIMEFLRMELARALLHGSLAASPGLELEFDKGTTGHALIRLAEYVYPETPLANIREIVLNRPDEFCADLQARLRLLRGIA